MRKRGLVVGLMVLGFAVSVLLVPGGPASAQQKVIKLGLTAAEGTPEVVASREFAKILAAKSNGAMRADVLAGGLAGGERDIVEGQQIGSLHMSVVSGIIQNFDPAMMILEYEFLFKNEDHVKKVMNGPIGEQINKRLAEKAKESEGLGGKHASPVVTQIVPATRFWRAEEYHQKYFQKNKVRTCGL